MAEKKHLPANACDVIMELAKQGQAETEIARAFGMALNTWKRIRDEDPAIMAALRAGRMVEHDALMRSLFGQAVSGKNVTAAIFLLKARHGYRDQGGDGGEPRVQVMINLPGAVDPATYARTIEATPTGREARRVIRGERPADEVLT